MPKISGWNSLRGTSPSTRPHPNCGGHHYKAGFHARRALTVRECISSPVIRLMMDRCGSPGRGFGSSISPRSALFAAERVSRTNCGAQAGTPSSAPTANRSTRNRSRPKGIQLRSCGRWSGIRVYAGSESCAPIQKGCASAASSV